MFHQLILAAATTATSTSPESQSVFQQNPFLTAIPFIIIAVVLWQLLLGGPQRRQAQQRESMISSVRKGDKVVTIGGIHGRVAKVDTEAKTVTVTVAKGVDMEFSQAAVSQVTRDTEEKEGK